MKEHQDGNNAESDAGISRRFGEGVAPGREALVCRSRHHASAGGEVGRLLRAESSRTSSLSGTAGVPGMVIFYSQDSWP